MRKLLMAAAVVAAALVPSLSHAAPATTNLALGSVATASSQESSAYPGSLAVDGDATTRWSSAFSDPQTLELDLGARASISEISLLWEASYGKAYTLAVSDDRQTWTNVASTSNSDGGTDDYPGLTASGRYVRLTGTARALPYGYSLFEFQVFGTFTQTAVAFAGSSYSMPEKDGTVTVPVRLNQASTDPVTVNYATADGTAEAGKDYQAASGSLTFAPGETEKTVTLHSVDDGIDEPNETFALNLTGPAGASLGNRPSATVTVADDDETAFSGKTLSVADYEGTLHPQNAPNGDNSGLFTFGNTDSDRPALTADPTAAPGSTGAQSMKVVSNINAWGGFSNNLVTPQDWSAYDGFSFWFKGSSSGHTLQFEIKDGGNDGEHSELFESHVTDDSSTWKLVRVPFSKFTKRTDYQPGGGPTDGHLDLTKMWGFSMNLGTGANSFLIDDVQVYQQVLDVETFEGSKTIAQRGITTFNGNNAPPTLTIESNPRDDAPDNHAMKVDYDIPSGQYGGFTQDLSDPQDWSAFAGIRFWYFGRQRSSAAPGRVYFEIKDGGTGPGASELWNTSFLDDTLGWHLVTIPFNTLQYRGDYQPVGGINHVLDLNKMWGYALTVPPGDKGSFDFDDVQVYGVAGAPPPQSAAADKSVYLANEGDTVNVGVKLTTIDGKPSTADLTVPYATQDGTATSADYTPASGTITFPAGTASGTVKTFPVAIATDSEAETAERIDVLLNGKAAASIVINANGLPYLDATKPIDQRVADLLSRMTTAEKIGQMTQAERQALDTPGDIATYNLGSLLSGGGSTPTPNTPQGWADMVDGFQTQALGSRLQIPIIYGVDAVHGHNNVLGATLFPHNIGLGAAHDPALVQQAGAITAIETKSTGVPWAFAPCLCVARDERWGRTYESFGEDPALVIKNETVINGLQDNGVLATAKHFAGDGGTTFGSSTTGGYTIDQGVTPLADMATLHLPPFAEAVRRGVGSVMPSYSSVLYPSGPLKMHANADLITGWLKQQQGFNGFVITDWQAIDAIPGDYASDVRTSINAGIDMVMVPYEYQTFESTLQGELDAGRVSIDRVNDAVKRILTQKFKLGLFEHPFADRSHQGDFGSAEHRAVARKAASESQVLLKNDGVLPLAKTAKVYVAGSNADDVGNQAGGWTVTWQGGSGNTAPGATTILAGMKAVDSNVTYSRTASASTAGYDVGVVVVGETPYAEGVGDVGNGRADLSLSAADRTAIDRVCGAMKCAVLVVSGRPMLVSDKLSKVGALVASWLPGSEGEGVADVLFGDQPFTGRLPMTWARSMAQLPINVGDSTYDPQFPYGWGLRTDSAKARLAAVGVTFPDSAWASGVALLNALRGVDLTGAPWAKQDAVVSVARDYAQAAMVRDGVKASTSALSAEAEHALYTGDTATALAKLSKIAVASTSTPGTIGGDVPATLSLTLGGPASFGALQPGVARDYTAQTTANVISTAGDATLSASGPVYLRNGASTLASPVAIAFSKASWSAPVTNDPVTITFGQHIGANDPLRTGTYSAPVTFTLATTNP